MQINILLDHYIEALTQYGNMAQERLIINAVLTGSESYINEWLEHFCCMKSSMNEESYLYTVQEDIAFHVPNGSDIEGTFDKSVVAIDMVTQEEIQRFTESGTITSGTGLHTADNISTFPFGASRSTSEVVNITVTDINGDPLAFNYWKIDEGDSMSNYDIDGVVLANYCNGVYKESGVPYGDEYNAPEGEANTKNEPKKDALTDSVIEDNDIYDSNADNLPENQNYNKDDGDPVDVAQQGIPPTAGGMQYNLLDTASINSFFNWFWNDIFKAESVTDFVFNSVAHLYGDLANCVLGLKYSPIPLDQATADTTHKIMLGRFESPLSATDARSGDLQRLIYVSGHVDRVTNNFLDVAPYTNAYWFLPFYGFAPCNINKMLNRDVRFSLYCDIRTGLARWLVDVRLKDGWVTCENYDFMLFIDQPINLDDGGRILQGITESISKVELPAVSTVANVVGGGIPSSSGMLTQSNCGTLLNTLCASSIYLIRTVPQYYRPDDMANTVGRVCNQTYKLSQLKGYCSFKDVKINFGKTKNSDNVIVYPTEEDMNEIRELLESGIMMERSE